jgi:hypothetical protein
MAIAGRIAMIVTTTTMIGAVVDRARGGRQAAPIFVPFV